MNDIIALMYDDLKNSLKLDKKLKDNSVIISFLNIKSNTRLNYLRENAYPRDAFGDILQRYIDDNLVVATEDDNTFQISAKAIWQIEKEYVVEDGLLLNYLEKKVFFSDEKKSKLSERHKIIILFLIICRTFAQETPLNLQLNHTILDKCEEILDESYDILHELKIITKLDKKEFFKKVGNEHRVQHLLQHTDDINKSGIPLRAPGNRIYYLDITRNKIINEDKMKFTLQKVLEREPQLSFEEIEDFTERIMELTHTKAIYINENNANTYTNIAVDKKIARVLEYLYD